MARILLVWLTLLTAGGAPLTQSPPDVEQRLAQVRRTLDRGAYVEAEREATDLRVALEAEGVESRDAIRALDLCVEALVRNGKAADSNTLQLAKQAVSLKQRRFGLDHAETAASLANLAAVNLERGDFKTAVALFEQALDIRGRRLPPDDQAVADNLDDLALGLIRLQRFDEARQRLERAERIRKAHADNAPSLAHTLELMALLQRYSGNYRAALPVIDRALEIRRAQSPKHPDIISSLYIRGDVVYLSGDLAGAQRLWTDALGVAEESLNPEHPTIELVLRRLAVVNAVFGQLTQSRGYLERGLRIAERSLAPCHPEFTAILNDLALSLKFHGEFGDAYKLYQRALTTREKCLGPSHSLTATIVHNQADLAKEVGDLAEAERLHQRAISMWSAGLGPTHPYVARGLDALAEVVASRGQHVRAGHLYQRALNIRRTTVGNDHPDVAWTLANLAREALRSGQVALARQQIEEAISIYQRVGASDDPDHLSRALALRGAIEARRDAVTARVSFAEALAIRERTYGQTHPRAAESRAEVAAADFTLGSYENAVSAALEAERAGREHLRFTIRYLPERQAMAYAAQRPRGLDLALSAVAAGEVADPSQVAGSLIQSRAVVLDELAARARLDVVADPQLASLNASLVHTRERFANLMMRSLREDESVPRQLLDDARRQKEDAERALAERSSSVRTELARAQAGLNDIRLQLPAGSALVSFVRYDRSTVQPGSNGAPPTLRRTPSYIAFVIHRDVETVAAIPLGPAAELEAIVAAWRKEAAGQSMAAGLSPQESERAYRAIGLQVRRRIWDPIATHLREASNVFIVPDGALNVVSFAALPIDGGRYIVDRAPVVHYMSTERDLLPNDTPSTNHGLLAVGGAAFDLGLTSAPAKRRADASTPQAGATTTNGPASRVRAGCGDLRSVQFAELPGSRTEVAELARLWNDVTVLTGARATERAFKVAVPGRQVLHLATHGFFLGSDCDSGPVGTRAVGGLTPGLSRSKRGFADNPLLLSGLALSGANNHNAAKTDQEDGILTAEEVAALNLQGTEWAVLSACDTGLGEIKAGEGVFGLRRAFQIAGARTVIMSLWSVDDDATRLWMRALYEGRLQKHLSTADAMQQASLSVLRARRARGESTHPFYWAGFVAAGDWR